MPYHLDQYGNEVDQNGYLRSAVEEWWATGLYPPPLAGRANAETVITVLAAREPHLDLPSMDDRELEHQIDAWRSGMSAASPIS